MDADKFREAAQRVLSFAGAMTKFTATPKDDQAVAILEHLVSDDVLFAKLKELLELK